MINEENLALAKDGVKLVNAARGGIIDEKAILAGLKSGKISSVGMDVFEKEPAHDNPLIRI